MDPNDFDSADTHQSGDPGAEPSGLGAGKSVGRYVLGELLGHGGMGLVFRATDPSLKREVALKLMRSANPDPGHLARFDREAQAMARLSHRNVVAVYDAGLDDGQPYLVMELVRGQSMRQWLSTPHTWQQALQVVVDAARGLEAAHAAGLVHRDFKPENVLVGEDGRVAVTDFGIARVLEPSNAPLTAPRVLIGTPGYMGPEQLAGGQADARTDQFALGVVLHEALTGAHPFAPQRSTPPIDGGVPARLLEVAARAMRPIPAERFASITELLRAVEQGPSAPPPAPPRRPRTWVLGVALLGLVLPAATYLFTRAPRVAAPHARSSNASASAAFTEGVSLWREGSTGPAVRRLREALAQDPQLEAALLWLALIDPSPVSARESFSRVRLRRATLAEDEQALLDALEPGQTPLPDLERWQATLDAQLKAHPDLSLLHWLRAQVLLRRGETANALAALDAAQALDAGLAPALAATRGRVERERHQVPEAIAAWTQCLATSPRATDCLAARARQLGLAGDCSAMNRDARAWAAADPADADAQLVLANALHAQGQPWPSVEEALKARREKLKPDERAGAEWYDEVVVAVGKGDFESARARAQRALDALPSSAGFIEHYGPAFTLLLVERELGDEASAAALANDFLQRASAWQLESAREAALVLLFVREAFRGGFLDRPQYVDQRARWLAVVEAAQGKGGRVDAYSKSIPWVVGYAAGARTHEDGVEALEALPRYAPLPPPAARGTDIDLVIGVVYALTDQPELALPRFEVVTRSCYRLENPFAWVFGLDWKGRALEALGRPDAARAEYQKVLDVWGGAKPRSMHAEAVKKRLAGLR